MKHLILILLLASCANVDIPETKPVDITYTFKWNNQEIMSKASYKWKKLVSDIKKNNQDYSSYLVEQIKANGLDRIIPSDAKEFGYKSGMDLTEFWGNVLVEVMFWESGWNKDQFYKEAFGDSQGQNVISRGMFQISVESVNNRNRANCDIKNYKELHDAKKNIWCGVRLISWFVKSDNRIAGKLGGTWKGAARYFSVLRGTRKYTRDALASIKAANK